MGIGHSLDTEQLVEIATEDSKAYVHTVGSFNTLDTVLPAIVPAACTGDHCTDLHTHTHTHTHR